MIEAERQALIGKRIMALDYGQRRIGVAVCDEMHILVSTRTVLENGSSVVAELLERLQRERTDVLVIGVPQHHDDRTTPIIQEIMGFIERVRLACPLPVYTVDEAFSTKEARQRMVRSGMKQKQRRAKGVKDQFAAAIILETLLNEVNPTRAWSTMS